MNLWPDWQAKGPLARVSGRGIWIVDRPWLRSLRCSGRHKTLKHAVQPDGCLECQTDSEPKRQKGQLLLGSEVTEDFCEEASLQLAFWVLFLLHSFLFHFHVLEEM